MQLKISHVFLHSIKQANQVGTKFLTTALLFTTTITKELICLVGQQSAATFISSCYFLETSPTNSNRVSPFVADWPMCFCQLAAQDEEFISSLGLSNSFPLAQTDRKKWQHQKSDFSAAALSRRRQMENDFEEREETMRNSSR